MKVKAETLRNSQQQEDCYVHDKNRDKITKQESTTQEKQKEREGQETHYLTPDLELNQSSKTKAKNNTREQNQGTKMNSTQDPKIKEPKTR